jgi:replicative DNA helicase
VIDVQLLRILKHHNEFKRLYHSIPENVMAAETRAVLEDFKKYFAKFPKHDTIDMTVFLPMFKRMHPGMNDEKFNSYKKILLNAMKEADDDTRSGIFQHINEIAAATDIANMLAEYEDGNVPDLMGAVQARVDTYKVNIGAKADSWINTPIEVLLEDEINDEGIRWRLSCLNESMRGLRGGDFGIIAGRPDKGKTTFITSEVTHMAKQLPKDRNILWLNNEGPGKRILPRLYQSALGLTMSEMLALNKEKRLVSEYKKAIGGRTDRIRVFDVHGFHVGQIELILEQNNPGIVVYDMIDHIRGFQSEARTDLQLEEMYKWARERSVKYDCIGLATSQISNEGDGLQFPSLGMLKDSKTGKQGACDFQLMIGASNDPGLAPVRWLGLPKNKLRREGAKGDPRAEVQFQPQIARYADVPEGE